MRLLPSEKQFGSLLLKLRVLFYRVLQNNILRMH